MAMIWHNVLLLNFVLLKSLRMRIDDINVELIKTLTL